MIRRLLLAGWLVVGLPLLVQAQIVYTPPSGGAVSANPTFVGQAKADPTCTPNPTWSFTGDTTTGLGSPSASNACIVLGGSTVMTWTPSVITSLIAFAVPDDAYGAGWNGSANVPTKNAVWDKIESLGTGAPADATYLTQTPNGTLSAEQALSALSTGIMRVATTTGVVTSLTDSAGIFANISNETGGTGVLVGSISPTLVTPILGVAAATSVTSTIEDAGTATVVNPFVLSHRSSGAPAANFGAGIKFVLDSATVGGRDATLISSYWTQPVDGVRSSAIGFNVVSSGGALTEVVSMNSTGSNLGELKVIGNAQITGVLFFGAMNGFSGTITAPSSSTITDRMKFSFNSPGSALTSGTQTLWNHTGGTFSPASGTPTNVGLGVNFTVNWGGTPGAGSYEGLRVAVTETAVPSGTKDFIAAYGGASGTTKRFSVRNTGAVIAATANAGTWEHGQISELITLSTSGATTDSTADLLPANAIIESVVARVTTTITTATDWQLGDATIAGRFSAPNATLTAGTTQVGTVHVDQTGTSGPRQVAAAKLRITTTGTPGAGVIRVTVFFRQFVPPTS